MNLRQNATFIKIHLLKSFLQLSLIYHNKLRCFCLAFNTLNGILFSVLTTFVISQSCQIYTGLSSIILYALDYKQKKENLHIPVGFINYKVWTEITVLVNSVSPQHLSVPWFLALLSNSPGPLAHCQQGASHQDHTPVPQASHATISSARKDGISASCCLFISEKSFPRSLHNVPS